VAEALAAAGIIYLQDSAAEIDGVKFYGSPWQPFFYAWAFNFHEFDPANGHSQAVKTWAKIPKDTQVLITHGPAYNILDLAPGHRHVGCPILRDKIFEIRPKLHLFGHIHMSYGAGEMDGIKFGNVALCDEGYKPVNPIQVFEV
jgi:Icc-related predicted phosphoesterase